MWPKINLILLIISMAVIDQARAADMAIPYPDNSYGIRKYIQLQTSNNSEVVAIRDQNPPLTFELDAGERFLSSHTRGYVAGVLTTSRLLAVSITSPDWQVYPLDINEAYSGDMLLSGRIILMVTEERAIVFDGGLNSFADYDNPLGESVVGKDAAPLVAAFATNKRAVAYALGTESFSPIEFGVGEIFRNIQATAGLVTVVTSDRYLTFHASTGDWTQREHIGTE